MLFAAAALGALAAVRWRPFRVEVTGGSMRPTLESGDWAIATRPRAVREGDVVVLERPDRPGLEVVKRLTRREPTGWFVLGDNPSGSTDSRHFGPVPSSRIRGRVRLIYWPSRRWRVV